MKEASWFYCSHFDGFYWTGPIGRCLPPPCPKDARYFKEDFEIWNDSTRSHESDGIFHCATDCPYIIVYHTREKMEKARDEEEIRKALSLETTI